MNGRKSHPTFKSEKSTEGHYSSKRLAKHAVRSISSTDPQMLLVDLVHDVDRLAEDREKALHRVLKRAGAMDRGRLARAVRDFGSTRAQRLLAPVLED